MSDTTSHLSSVLPSDANQGYPPPASPFSRLAARQLRLWPAVVLIVLQLLLLTVPGWVAPGTMTHFMSMYLTPMIAGVFLAIWWLFASRAPWLDRILALVVFGAAWFGARFLAHPSFRDMGFILYGLPVLTTIWVLWLLLTRSLNWPIRRVGLLLLIVLTWASCTLIRFNGVTGGMSADLAWRWSPTPEDQLLAELADGSHHDAKPSDAPSVPVVLQPGDWSSFRGPQRDARFTGAHIRTDWTNNPPRQVWRHRVGPGWSSFAVVDGRLFTQEQRGENEVVVCYDAKTGAEQWVHQDATRFSELVAGPGPRATPTFHQGKLYTLGANGQLNCLDAATGKPHWEQSIKTDSGAPTPTWGFSSSPLVMEGLVIVCVGGLEGKGVLAYKADSGKLAWSAGEGLGHSYSSPHRATLDGVEQVLVVTEAGLTAVNPTDGAILWQDPWPLQKGMAHVVQPAILDRTDLLIGSPFGLGTRRVRVTHKGKDWDVKEVWTSRDIKPYYNDLVVHKGYLYGFDGVFFTCVSLDDGAKTWRTRGYGNGQVLLLADQDLLLVLSEKGEAVLLETNPERHQVVGRFQAIEGKTWNHPVVAHGKLFVRNGEEAACYDVAPDGGDR